ncbi:hypothetical protein G4G28_13685 [Massilia sp. Dwa41.01b]|uniref:hypothetical protein n=1 Tax=unclassified Massilia TaxID=2609279 RepID=UPI0016034243|nr:MULTISPECIES: hypothetical protein [unclassified Massilia]QNA89255.1 hypothetical protein G4G28_13685 [Massilia sp. Dwa41.01b]QNB00155.1 hypothetical protein G4G31_17230 [Massilia sp. Se16.2.3]
MKTRRTSLRLVLALAASVPLAASAACVFHCESADCAWEKVAPPACTQAEPFHSEEKWKAYADGLKTRDAPLQTLLAELKALHFSCARARRDLHRWDCGRVLKTSEACAEHTTLTIRKRHQPARRARRARPSRIPRCWRFHRPQAIPAWARWSRITRVVARTDSVGGS